MVDHNAWLLLSIATLVLAFVLSLFGGCIWWKGYTSPSRGSLPLPFAPITFEQIFCDADKDEIGTPSHAAPRNLSQGLNARGCTLSLLEYKEAFENISRGTYPWIKEGVVYLVFVSGGDGIILCATGQKGQPTGALKKLHEEQPRFKWNSQIVVRGTIARARSAPLP